MGPETTEERVTKLEEHLNELIDEHNKLVSQCGQLALVAKNAYLLSQRLWGAMNALIETCMVKGVMTKGELEAIGVDATMQAALRAKQSVDGRVHDNVSSLLTSLEGAGVFSQERENG